MTRRALIASGAGRYGDPWHPFAETSALLAEVLTDTGFAVVVDSDVDGALTRLEGVDLLVVNAGDPWRDGAAFGAPVAAVAGLTAALGRGMGVLAVHSAVSSLRDHPLWAAAIGAVWLPGVSMHPEIGRARITGGASAGSVGSGCGAPFAVEDFEVFDERYCRLQRIGDSTIVATHVGAAPGDVEPTAWVREVGAARVAVSVLGHDARAYESPGHRALLRTLALWAARG